MAIDYQAIADSGGLGKGVPRGLSALERRRAQRAALAEAYAAVDARDRLVSLVSGAALSKRLSAGPNTRIVRHHLARRSQAKGRIADPDNIMSCAAVEAIYLDAHALVPVDAEGEEVKSVRAIVGFAWNRNLVPVGHEPRRWKPVRVINQRAGGE